MKQGVLSRNAREINFRYAPLQCTRKYGLCKRSVHGEPLSNISVE